MGPLVAWTASTFALWIAARIIPGFGIGFGAAALAALAFGFLNWGLEWLLFTELGIATLGIPFLLGIQLLLRCLSYAAVLRLGCAVMKTLTVRGWAAAFWAAAVPGFVSLVVDYLL